MSASLSALRQCVRDLDHHVGQLGWDRPPTVFALVSTCRLVGEVDLGAEANAHLAATVNDQPDHLSAIIQDTPSLTDLDTIATTVVFPPSVEGAAVCVERLSLPPQAEADLPEDPQEQLEWVAAHPLRRDIRIIAARLRTGERWCAIRARDVDDPTALIEGDDLAGDLLDALGWMLTDDETEPDGAN